MSEINEKLTKELSQEQREALRQKEAVLAKGKYATIPHGLYRVAYPEIRDKYGGQVARDCVFLYTYFHAYVNGQSENEAYMWAFPTVKQINEGTGIHGDRIKGLCDILESEGLLLTKKIPWIGNTKKMYMPLIPDKIL